MNECNMNENALPELQIKNKQRYNLMKVLNQVRINELR